MEGRYSTGTGLVRVRGSHDPRLEGVVRVKVVVAQRRVAGAEAQVVGVVQLVAVLLGFMTFAVSVRVNHLIYDRSIYDAVSIIYRSNKLMFPVTMWESYLFSCK